MRINKLSFRNFKGHNGDYELAPVTIVCGPNFSAKTSIPLAIRLGLTGYLPPPIGQKGIYSLAGNPEQMGEMAIRITLEKDRNVFWLWKKDAKGKLSVSSGVPPDLKMPELLMEPRLFFQKTTAERTAIIFGACDVTDLGFSPDLIVNRLREVNVPPVAICQETLEEVQKAISDLSNLTPQQFCGNLLEWLKAQQKQASDASKASSGAFGAFRIGDGSKRLVDVSNELGEKRTELAKLQVSSSQSLEMLNARLEQVNKALASQGSSEVYNNELQELAIVIRQPPIPEDEMDERGPEIAAKAFVANQQIQGQKVLLSGLEAKIAQLEVAKCCPTCGNKRKGWKTEAVESLMKERDDAMVVLKHAEKEHESATQLLDCIRAWEQAVSKAKEITALRDAVGQYEVEKAKLEKQIDCIEQDDSKDELVEQLQAEIASLEQQQREFDQHKGDLKRREALESKLSRDQCRTDVFKAVTKIVTEEQGKLTDKAFGEVLKTAQHFTSGLLNSPLEFSNGELGRRVSDEDVEQGNTAAIGSWISHEVFSGTEELLAYAGFSIALVKDAPVKIVMLDELGRLDTDRKKHLAIRMLELADSDIIDQAILVDVNNSSYRSLNSENLKIITL